MEQFTKFRRCIYLALCHAILPILFISASALYAQTPQSFKIWDKTLGGGGEEKLSIVIPASDGGYLLGGTSNSAVGGDKSAPNYGGNDYWIVKVDENGVRQWDKSYGSTYNESLSSIIATNDGGYLLGGADSWIVKINQNGVKEWDKRYSSGNLTSMTKALDGGYLLGSTSGYSYVAVKIDSMGEKQWSASFGTEYQFGIHSENILSSVVASPDGGFLLVGSSWGSGGDRTCGSNDDLFDGWVIKIDSNGIKQWDKCYQSVEMDYLNAIIPTSDGGYLLGGHGNFEFSGGKGFDDYHVVKINSNGDVEWEHLYGGESGNALTALLETPGGGYLLGGYSNSNNFEDKTEPNLSVYRDPTYNYWIVKINAAGKKEWDKSFSGGKGDILSSLALTPTGGYLLGGYSSSSIFADKSQPARSYYNDFWIIKTSSGPPAPETAKITFQTVEQASNIEAIVSNPYFATKVEFFADGVKVGEDQSAPFQHTLMNLAPGIHYIYTKVFDQAGNSITSYTIPITISVPGSYFYRGINLNGPEVSIKEYSYIDNIFESSTYAGNFTFQAKAFENQYVKLVPGADPSTTLMLRSSLYATKSEPASFTLSAIRKGAYEVYLYVWEDNNPQTFSITVNGSLALANYNSGNGGQWAKLGPFKTNIADDNGTITIKVEGGDANISGIELRTIYANTASYESLYRAVNLNGPTYKINNLSYEGSAQAANFSYRAKAFANQSIPLVPVVGGELAQMIRSSLASTSTTPATFTFKNVPHGDYDVFVYVWEDNNPEDFFLSVNGGYIQYFNSGAKGQWKIIGPLETTVESGTLLIEAGWGTANISAIEVWKRRSDLSAKSSGNDQVSKTIVYPNSISDHLTISLPANQKGVISTKIVDITGRTYLDNTQNISGEKELTLDVPYNKMKTGVYFLHIQYDGKKEVIRLNKE